MASKHASFNLTDRSEIFYTDFINQHETDASLDNWERWLRIHKSQQDYLSKATKRPKECLVMNQEEDPSIRRLIWLLDEAENISRNKEIYLNFWKNPSTLKWQIWDSPEGNKMVHEEHFGYFLKPKLRTKEYVVVPTKIREEKGFTGKPCEMRHSGKWLESEYMEQKKETLKEEIDIVTGHLPDLMDLIVIGKSCSAEIEEERYTLPTIVIEDLSNEQFDENHMSPLEVSCGVAIYRIIERGHPACLRIGDLAISKKVNIFNYPNTLKDIPLEWEISFVNVHVRQGYMKYIEMENIGPMVIRFKWKKLPKPDGMKDLPLRHSKHLLPRFYFNSKPDLILPGQINKLHIWCKSSIPGKYSEVWELITRPKIHKNKVLFYLDAVVTEEEVTRPWTRIDRYLDKEISHQTAMKAVITARKNMHRKNAVDIPYSRLLEKEMEAFTFMNPPHLNYDFEIVKELKQMYQTLFSREWNLNLGDFYEELVNADLGVLEKEMELQKLKNLKEQMDKLPKTNRPKTFFHKYRSVYSLLCEAASKIEEIGTKLRGQYKPEMVTIQLLERICKTPTSPREPVMPEMKYNFEIERDETQTDLKANLKSSKGKKKKTAKGGETAKETAMMAKTAKHTKTARSKASTRASSPKKVSQKELKRKELPRSPIHLMEKKQDMRPPMKPSELPEGVYGELLYASVYSIMCDAIDNMTSALEGMNLDERDFESKSNKHQYYSCIH